MSLLDEFVATVTREKEEQARLEGIAGVCVCVCARARVHVCVCVCVCVCVFMCERLSARARARIYNIARMSTYYRMCSLTIECVLLLYKITRARR